MDALDSKSSGNRYGRPHDLAAIDYNLRRDLGAPLNVQIKELRDMERQWPGVGWGKLAAEYEAAHE